MVHEHGLRASLWGKCDLLNRGVGQFVASCIASVISATCDIVEVRNINVLFVSYMT